MASPRPSDPELPPLFPLIARLRAGAVVAAFLALRIGMKDRQAAPLAA